MGTEQTAGSVAATAAGDGATVGDEVATLERLREIVRLAPIGVGIVDLGGHTILTNEALCGMLGYSAEEFAELTFEAFTHKDDIARNEELFAELVAGKRDAFEMDKRYIHKDGSIVWGRLLVSLLREGDGQPSLAIGLLQDITEQRQLREELERQAFHDPLTDLANRRLFHDRVEHRLRRGSRPGGLLGAVLFADVDDFKTLNDSLGHQAGDQVLCSLAERVVSCLRPGDTAGRLGGDEFAVLLEEVGDTSDAVAVAERVQAAVGAPLEVSDRIITPSISIGVTLLQETHDAERALRDADLAMYRAKSLGKGRVATYTPELLEAAMRKLDRETVGRPIVRSDDASAEVRPMNG